MRSATRLHQITAAKNLTGLRLPEHHLSFTTAALARKAEQWLKRLRRREYTDMIIGDTFDWPERFGLVAIEEPAK